MKSLCLAALLAAALVPAVRADQQFIEVYAIDAVDPEQGVLNRFERSAISYVEEKITIEVGGMTKEEIRKVPVERRTSHEWKIEDYLVLDHEGRPLEKNEIWKRLKPGTIVFHVEQRSFTGAFLKTLAPGATVLLLKQKPPGDQPIRP
jgi:hypothetical protein